MLDSAETTYTVHACGAVVVLDLVKQPIGEVILAVSVVVRN